MMSESKGFPHMQKSAETEKMIRDAAEFAFKFVNLNQSDLTIVASDAATMAADIGYRVAKGFQIPAETLSEFPWVEWCEAIEDSIGAATDFTLMFDDDGGDALKIATDNALRAAEAGYALGKGIRLDHEAFPTHQPVPCQPRDN